MTAERATAVACGRATLLAHPIAVVAVVAAARAVWDVARARPLGAYPIDDAGFSASALGLHARVVTDGPGAALGDALHLSGGPLVPLLDVPVLAVFGRTVTALAVVPAVGLAVAAVLVAAIAARLAPPAAALAAGVTAVGLPAAVLAGRSHQVVTVAAPALLLAVWALLASDRGRRRWTLVLCGAAVAAAVLSRPMTIAYVPGLVICGALVVERGSRARAAGLAAVVAVALLVPWLLVAGGDVADYLLGHGYGAEARDFGSSSPILRVGVRILLTAVDLRVGLGLLAVVVGVVAGREAVRRGLHRRLPTGEQGRAVLGVAVVVVAGEATLLTTANSGVWFELPLELLALAVAAGLAPLLGRWVRPIGRAAVVAAVVFAVGIGSLPSPRVVALRNDGDDIALSTFLFAGPWETGLVEVDPRWRRPGADIDAQAADWAQAHRDVIAALAEVGVHESRVGVASGAGPMNLNSLLMVGRMGGDVLAGIGTVRTGPGPTDFDAVVLIDAASKVLPGETSATAMRLGLVQGGWTSGRRVGLPDGGEASVWLPPRMG